MHNPNTAALTNYSTILNEIYLYLNRYRKYASRDLRKSYLFIQDVNNPYLRFYTHICIICFIGP